MHARTRPHRSPSLRLLGALVFASVVGVSVTSASAATAPQGPTGDWVVENGKAVIRVVNCGGQYWGVVAWERNPGGTDVNNPSPALRSRPTLGMPILLGMAPAADPGTWRGQIYNSQDGRTYSGRISLRDANTLHVEGCVLGFLCGGQDWHRATGAAALAQAQPRSGRGGRRGGTASLAEGPAAKVCSTLVR